MDAHQKKPSDLSPSNMFQPTNFNMDSVYKAKFICNFFRPNNKPSQEMSPQVRAYNEGAHASDIQ